MPQRSEGFGPATATDAVEQHHFGSRLLDPLAARHAWQRAHAEDLAGAASAGEVKGARKLGARHTATDLGEHLGDDWVLIHNLQTTAGPIGQLLLGPSGVVALTSLYLNATVICHGDKWHAEKPEKPEKTANHGQHPGNRDERGGHHHDREPTIELSLNDHDGRSPSVQLNQAADTLERFLRAAGVGLKVERAVLINHPRPGDDELHRPTVHVFSSTWDFRTWLHKLPKFLDRGQKRQVEVLISGGA